MNKMTIKNTLVQPKDIPTIWSFAEKHLKKRVNRSYGRISLNDLFTECVMGQSHLWIFYRDDEYPDLIGCGITQINDYPSGLRMLNIDHLSGKNQELWTKDGLKKVESFAKDSGCDGIEALGRPGFWNWLKDDNWDKIAVAYQKKFVQ